MRWDALFADLESEITADLDSERRAEVADRTRSELGRLRLIDRLGPLLPPSGGEVRLGLDGHEAVIGTLAAMGADWVLLSADASGEASLLVSLAAVQWVQGLSGASAEPGWEGAVGARSTLRLALRRVVRDRSMVRVGLTAGEVFNGRLSRVGADHVELGARGPGDPGDSGAGAGGWTGTRAIPLAAIAFVRRS